LSKKGRNVVKGVGRELREGEPDKRTRKVSKDDTLGGSFGGRER